MGPDPNMSRDARWGQEWVTRGPHRNSALLPKNQAKFSLSMES